MIPDGFLLIHKETGESSFDVLRTIKRLIGAHSRGFKLGHAGTLDPFADGLLICLLGDATRFSDYWMHGRKTYSATLKLGCTTESLDTETPEILDPTFNPNRISESAILTAMDFFLNHHYLQIPPVYSAKKINGKKAYELARTGRSEEAAQKLAAVQKKIFTFKLLEWPVNGNPNFLRFEAMVESGTYIRTLGYDLAQRLGTTGYLTQLTRTSSGHLTCQNALSSKKVGDLEHLFKEPHFVGLKDYLQQQPTIDLSNTEFVKLRCGEKSTRLKFEERLKKLSDSSDSSKMMIYRLSSDAYPNKMIGYVFLRKAGGLIQSKLFFFDGELPLSPLQADSGQA